MTMKHHLRPILLAVSAAFACTLAAAKLPPLPPEAAAKAAEAAARTAWSGKVDQYKLCQAQDRVVAQYRSAHADAKPASLPTGACMDPGPFAYTPVEQKPLESSGAHSPPGTASSPPSTQVPEAESKASAPRS